LETTTLLLIILAVFTALFIAVFQYLFKEKKESQLNYWLSLLRFISIFLIFILILNPSIKKSVIEVVKPKLLIAVDNSASIKYTFQESNVNNLVELFKKDEELNDKFLINYFGFGSTISVLDSLNFSDPQTNLALPLQEFSKIYKSANNPVVLISDGNQTLGSNIEFSNYKNPVYPFIVGDTTILEDIFIKQLNVNKFSNINNKFPVEIFINYEGAKSVSKKLSIYHNKQKVYSKLLHFSKDETVKTESFFLTATTKGTQYYTAIIDELDNEQNTLNNSKTFSINIIEEKSNILVLSSITHPDLGMLKKTIESNELNSVTISNSSNYKGNISDYQLIILNQPTNEFKNIFEEIKAENLNYFIISGLNTDWEFLNKIQKDFSKNIISQSQNYHPVFNANYSSFLSDDIGFSDFAPLNDSFGDITFNIPYNTLLFKKVGTIETQKPLLATFENKNQRSGILFGENSWRWRMNSYVASKTFENFNGFISNLVQYLSSNSKNKRLTISAKPIYYANETIQISASYLDKNFNFDSRAKLWLTVLNKENNFLKKIPFAALQTKFVAELSNLIPTEYTFSISVDNNKDLTASGNLKILPFEIEQQFSNANNKSLKILAAKTKGRVYYSNQEIELIKNLKDDERYKSIQKTNIVKIPLINWKWILALILLSLSLEWFIRKYYGKI